jgi:PAS domain S-box-containing protein
MFKMTHNNAKYPEAQSLPGDFMKNILKYSDNPEACAEYVASLMRNLIEKLAKSEKLFRSLFEQASDGIFFFDSSGGIISVNESFARLHGYSVEEMLCLGLNGLDVEGAAHIPERLQRIMAGEILTFEVEHYHKDGHIFPLEVTAYLISAGNEQIIIAIHRNITERKIAKEKLLRLNEELDQRVRERTKELERRNRELEQMNKAFVGRELKMVELKKRIKELELKIYS